MSYFYGTIQGSRSEASKCGSFKSGMKASIASYNFGCKIRMFVGAEGEVIKVYLTSGSNSMNEKLVATYTKDDL